jgi:hypothetical protein
MDMNPETRTRLDKMVARVKALLNKAADQACPETEAAALRDKAAEIMAEHSIEEAALADKPRTVNRYDMTISGKYAKPRMTALYAILEGFGLKVVYAYDGEAYILKTVGVEADRQAALALWAEIDAMLFRTVPKLKPTSGATRGFRGDYIVGFGYGLGEKMKVRRVAAKNTARTTGFGPGLILVSEDELTRREFAAQFRNVRATRIRAGEGYGVGHVAGQSYGATSFATGGVAAIGR